ncbi:MAG: hypothetical protein ACOC9Y_00490 [Chloroflexota bacterium]
MPDDRNRQHPFDDEPEVTYEPLPQETERRRSGESSRWLTGGAVAGSAFGAGSSALGDLRESLDIFDFPDAADEPEPGPETSPIDFGQDPETEAPQGAVEDLIHGAESEAGGGFTLDEFESLDLPDPPDDLTPEEDYLAGDDVDDLDFE